MINRDRTFLYLGVVSFALSLTLLIVSRSSIIHGLVEVVVIAAGTLFMAGLGAFQRFANSQRPTTIQISFDAAAVEMLLTQLSAKLGVGETSPKSNEFNRLREEPTVDSLVGRDNELALAKLRIDLERAFRHVAHNWLKEQPAAGLQQLVSQLSIAGAISDDVVAAINEILPVLNQAVHGGKVSTSTALDVARAGQQLITVLSYYANNSIDFPNSSTE